ncbi:MAG TPA: hypothetical protein PLQ88_06860, partial [Blastocatellia bacterium]|nr:hypothetical protein [Blastocatellia bacterium]
LRGEAANPEAVCANYAALLKSRPPDFAVLEMGIDPPDCDSAAVNVIELNEAYRRQQVRDGAFAELEDVPTKALSLTRQTIMNCEKLFLIAPESHRQNTESRAASILRSHPNARFFLDREAALTCKPL